MKLNFIDAQRVRKQSMVIINGVDQDKFDGQNNDIFPMDRDTGTFQFFGQEKLLV